MQTQRSAYLSECGVYRYNLVRVWDRALATACFVMLNPSIADAHLDDPTVRKCIGFAHRFGCGSIEVVNLWPYRATHPRDLHAFLRARGLHHPSDRVNDITIRGVAECAKQTGGVVVCGWGAHGRRYTERQVQVMDILRDSGAPVRALNLLSDGTPQHPLMVPYSAVLKPYV